MNLDEWWILMDVDEYWWMLSCLDLYKSSLCMCVQIVVLYKLWYFPTERRFFRAGERQGVIERDPFTSLVSNRPKIMIGLASLTLTRDTVDSRYISSVVWLMSQVLLCEFDLLSLSHLVESFLGGKTNKRFRAKSFRSTWDLYYNNTSLMKSVFVMKESYKISYDNFRYIIWRSRP